MHDALHPYRVKRPPHNTFLGSIDPKEKPDQICGMEIKKLASLK